MCLHKRERNLMQPFFDTLAEALEGSVAFCELCETELETVTADYCEDCVDSLNWEAERAYAYGE